MKYLFVFLVIAPLHIHYVYEHLMIAIRFFRQVKHESSGLLSMKLTYVHILLDILDSLDSLVIYIIRILIHDQLIQLLRMRMT